MPDEGAIRIPVKITNTGGAADQHRLRLIDAGEMYTGISRVISYCLLSLEAGTLVDRAARSGNVQIYQRKTEDNCITHQLVIEFTKDPSAFELGVATGVLGNYLTRFLDFCIKTGAGIISGDRDGHDTLLHDYQRVEPFFDDLVEKIEPHLLAIHAPIRSEAEKLTISLGESTTLLDMSTKDYLASSEMTKKTFRIIGTVTRLNILTGNGRFYSEDIGHIVPFSQAPRFRRTNRSQELSWSLRQNDRNLPATIEIFARKINTSTRRLKKLYIENAQQLEIS